MSGQSEALRSGAAKANATALFMVGFLILFLELACIRWFSAYVVFLQFFTNVVLLASFLGMSCGCLAARSGRDWLGVTPALALGAVLAALAMLLVYQFWSGVAIDVGSQGSPQEIFFGTEFRNPDVAAFSVPIEAIVAVFFVLISLIFVGPGQVLGQAFDAYPDRIRAYVLNIGGSLAGIVGFSALSLLHAPPALWFAISAVVLALLLRRRAVLTGGHVGVLVALVFGVSALDIRGMMGADTLRWSPYYAVQEQGSDIVVNTIGHQQMVRFDQSGSLYSLIHLLQRASGGKPFEDVLVIGAGSGNDLDHALRFGVGRIDAVEIDPVIQDIGIRRNPDRPYQDSRVVRHLDDGRHFVRTTERKYDLVVYALVDSLILHSGYSNLRLESYLFTDQAFADIGRVLKPGGTFVTYNYFRQGWVVERMAAMAEKAFGCAPMVLSLPYVAQLAPADPAGFSMVIAGCDRRIAEAFAREPSFWLHVSPPRNLEVDGFKVRPAAEAGPPANWNRIAPTRLVHDAAPVVEATDDWPFLYLRGAVLPGLSVRFMVVIGAISAAMIYLFLPRGRVRIDNRMFFLGAAFMLLETKAVVQLALLFGSTWLVNSAVFFSVLVLLLLANLFVLRARAVPIAWHYAGLLAFLLAGIFVPTEAFLGGGVVLRYVAPCLLALGPIFFAGAIFAQSFRDVREADQAFGSNIAGSIVGGLAESVSMLIGFRLLLVVAIVLYGLSMISPGRKG